MTKNAVSSLEQSTAVLANAVRLTSNHARKLPEVTKEFASFLLTNRPVVIPRCVCRSRKRPVSPLSPPSDVPEPSLTLPTAGM